MNRYAKIVKAKLFLQLSMLFCDNESKIKCIDRAIKQVDMVLVDTK